MRGTSKYDREVLSALECDERFRSCQEIHSRLAEARGGGSRPPSLSTVYRTLHRLARQGEIDTIHAEDGERLYRRCETSPHHHLLCRICGRVEEVPHAWELRPVLDRVGYQSGFSELGCSLQLSGVCPDCGRSVPTGEAPEERGADAVL
ncbi:Fur family transcriptional regulator [Nocardiopsis lambiniae]|uniref:Transcriptional repressor n=1 Tax=Nocardiopsis lambiniae TaxID=3075539 RepID=A0ABU2M9S8_9ACTN|nr:transcriptional repressor [Nocardiopsis sp. DSM 44743]MDT0329431.1 transcriptional repressor [Nocardiopsis sp. DSM 44743]